MLEILKPICSVLASVYLLLGVSVFLVLLVKRFHLKMPAIQIRLYIFGRLALSTSNEFLALVLILLLWPVISILLFDNSSPDPSGRETIDNITVLGHKSLDVVANTAAKEADEYREVA